jgi:hypothetical protein
MHRRCMLALCIALIHTNDGGDPRVALYIFLATFAYAVFMLLVVRPVWVKVRGST